MIRDHYRNTEIRKAELDPSTFDHAEDFQREPRDGRWIALGYGGALLIGVGFWAALFALFF